jgi:tight adherence protein C
MLIRAGFTIGTAEYTLIRFLVIAGLGVLLAAGAFLLTKEASSMTPGLLLGLFLGYVIMRYHLALTITKRRGDMERQLPDVLDLLSLSVEAGLGFEQALYHIINHFTGPLIDELSITYREISMGRTRRDALTYLGERCDIGDIKSFAGALVQSSQLGISLKNVLRSQSTAIRQAKKNKIEEKAMKISVKILVPMVLFIFPVVFIVLLGPAILNIMEVLG